MNTQRADPQRSPKPLILPLEVPLNAHEQRLMTRVRSEFVEMPCLSLAAPQAQRLFGLTSQECERVLGRLVASGFLSNTHGVFRRHTGA